MNEAIRLYYDTFIYLFLLFLLLLLLLLLLLFSVGFFSKLMLTEIKCEIKVLSAKKKKKKKKKKSLK